MERLGGLREHEDVKMLEQEADDKVCDIVHFS
jgi:hypothetical protein